MKFGEYKRLKKLLDDPYLRELCEYSFNGHIKKVDEGQIVRREYRVSIIPLGDCIYALNLIFGRIENENISYFGYLDSHISPCIRFH